MNHHHSFPKTLAAGLATVCLLGAQYACQADAPGQADAEEQMGAEQEAGGGEVHWSYEGATGADMWGGLDPSFAVCDTGVQQSPIDLAGAIPGGRRRARDPVAAHRRGGRGQRAHHPGQHGRREYDHPGGPTVLHAAVPLPPAQRAHRRGRGLPDGSALRASVRRRGTWRWSGSSWMPARPMRPPRPYGMPYQASTRRPPHWPGSTRTLSCPRDAPTSATPAP